MSNETLKVAELAEFKLDYYVAIAAGHAPISKYGERVRIRLSIHDDSCCYNPSSNWAIGGPLFSAAEIGSQKLGDNEWTATDWCAKQPHFYANGPTELIAKARCFVTMKFGDTVPAQPGRNDLLSGEVG